MYILSYYYIYIKQNIYIYIYTYYQLLWRRWSRRLWKCHRYK